MRMRSPRTSAALALAAAVVLGALLAPAARAAAPGPPAAVLAARPSLAAQSGTLPSTVTATSVVTKIDDPASTRTVNRVIAALLILGGVLLAVTIWFWVATKPLHPSLEGLELMSHRRWAKASPDKQQRLLDKVHRSRGDVDEHLVPLAQVGGAPAPVVPVGRAVGDHTPPP